MHGAAKSFERPRPGHPAKDFRTRRIRSLRQSPDDRFDRSTESHRPTETSMKARQHAPLTRSPIPAPALLALTALLVSPALAAPAFGAGPPGADWTLRAHAVQVSPADEAAPSGPGTLSMDDGTGFGLDLEYRVTPRFGVELSAFTADLDGRFRLDTGGVTLEDTEPIAITSYSLGLNLHFRSGGRVDFHAGLFGAMSTFDDVIFLSEAGLREKRSFDDDHGFGLKVGADIAVTPDGAWALSASARYLLTILEAEESGSDLDLDPLIVTAGVAWRF
jgi:outer membrane protein W